jgi:hypothetical protein
VLHWWTFLRHQVKTLQKRFKLSLSTFSIVLTSSSTNLQQQVKTYFSITFSLLIIFSRIHRSIHCPNHLVCRKNKSFFCQYIQIFSYTSFNNDIHSIEHRSYWILSNSKTDTNTNTTNEFHRKSSKTESIRKQIKWYCDYSSNWWLDNKREFRAISTKRKWTINTNKTNNQSRKQPDSQRIKHFLPIFIVQRQSVDCKLFNIEKESRLF